MSSPNPAQRNLYELATQVGSALCARKQILAVAESCTGGWIGKSVTDIAGSSGWFDRGFVTYSNVAKTELLGVREATLARHGAVSAEVVTEMVAGALERSRADIALAVSGVAGPDGGTADKPVGTVYLAWALRGNPTHTVRQHFDGDREAVRLATVAAALQGYWMCAPTGDERRLFLALWPGDAERRQLAELAAAVAGRRRVRDANLHLTLVFLGATDAARLAAYEAALTDLAVPSLELILDRYGYWPRPRILWLGSSHTPPELYELVAELHRRLRGRGFTPERRAFQAHITLARKFSGPAPTQPLVAPIRWRVNEVALVESQSSPEGSRYRVLRR